MGFRSNKVTEVFLPIDESTKLEVNEVISNFNELSLHIRVDITQFIQSSIFNDSPARLILAAFPEQIACINSFNFGVSLTACPKFLPFEFEGKKQAVVITDYTLPNHGESKKTILVVSNYDIAVKLLKLLTEVDRNARVKKGIAVCRNYGNEYVPCSNIYTWDHIFWPKELKEDIKNNIEFFLNKREWFLDHGLPWKRGFLLAGPPGNGKTLLSKVLASTYNFTCYMFDFFDDFSSANRFKEMYDNASRTAPSIILIEDLDRVLTEKEDGISMANVGLDTILNVLDGVTEYQGIITIATANNLDLIDPALRHRPKRFDRVFEVTNPDHLLRKEFLTHLFKNISTKLLDKLVEDTDEFSMAFISELHVKACIDAGVLGREPIDEDINLALKSIFPHWNSEKNKTVGFN